MFCSNTYQVLKDFAGPVAAIIGAVVVARITFVINRGQKRIAESQRDIALDQLKFNLFEKRYEIYRATKVLLEYVPFIQDIEKSDSNKLRSLAVTMDEARFYFPPDICTFLRDIGARCEIFFERLRQRALISIDDSEQWSKMADALGEDQAGFRAIYASLPQVFEVSLAFKQLTTDKNRYDQHP